MGEAPVQTPDRAAAEAAREERAEQERRQREAERLPRSEPDDPAALMAADAPESLRDAVREERIREIDDDGEKSAMSYLLGQQASPKYKIPFKFDTPAGLKDFEWHVHALDGKKIDNIEDANTDKSGGPFETKLDDYTASAEILREASIKIVDKGSGEEILITDESWLARNADPAQAIKQRFHWQSGTMIALAGAVRRISGFAGDRVGEASRVLAVAAGNS